MHEILDSIKSWIIRFFDGLSNDYSDHIEQFNYMVQLIEKERLEKNRLLEELLKKNEPVEIESNQEFKPIISNKPWHVRKRELEAEDRERFLKRARDNNIQVDNTKSTDELEKELGVNNG